MAKKYIDADKLIANLERQNVDKKVIEPVIRIINSLQQEQSCDTCTNDKGCVTCKDGELWEGKEQPIGIHDIGVEGEKGADGSLVMQEYDKQEQPSEDLEVEMGKYFDGWHDDPEYGQAVLPHTYQCVGVSDCKDIARHFYELGKANKEDKK